MTTGIQINALNDLCFRLVVLLQAIFVWLGCCIDWCFLLLGGIVCFLNNFGGLLVVVRWIIVWLVCLFIRYLLCYLVELLEG